MHINYMFICTSKQLLFKQHAFREKKGNPSFRQLIHIRLSQSNKHKQRYDLTHFVPEVTPLIVQSHGVILVRVNSVSLTLNTESKA